MANDIPDYSSSVVVQSGSVTVTGTANVQVTNTPSVTISGTPAVTVNSGTVSIGNTPSVTISGTPTVILGAGVATIGTIQAISSTVTVAGTINIGNTPAVSISGTPTVNIGNSPAVTITSGTVTISGTVTVAVSGNVNIGTTPGPADSVVGPGVLNGLGVTVGAFTTGLQGAGMFLAAGTLIGTIVPEVSMDGGTTWVASTFINPVDQTTAASIVFASANTATTRTILIPAGTTKVRVRVSAYTSGTANVTLSLTAAQSVNVLIAGTPTVNIGGTPTVNIGNTPAVTINSGSVTATISGTPNVNLQSSSITLTVSVSNTPAVTISGTPNVNISSGSVSITGTPNINISSQSVTLSTNQPQTALADLVFPNGTSTQTTAAVPAGTHALQLTFTGAFTSFAVKGHQTLIQYAPQDAGSLGANAFPPNVMVWVIPVNSIQDTTYDCVATQATGGNVTVKVSAILDSQAVWVQSTKVNPVWTAQVGSVSATGAFVARAAIIQEYDATGVSAPAAGTQATVTLAASAGKSYIAHTIRGGRAQTAATATANDLQLLDGVTVIYSEPVYNTAAIGAGSTSGVTGAAYKGTAGNAMTLKISAAVAGANDRVNIGAYLRA